jgi:hypothetical protein
LPAYEHHDVRTTVTIDDDVAARLRAEVRRSGRTFKEVVNHYLRLGFAKNSEKQRPFRVQARDLGILHTGVSLDCIATLTDVVEGSRHR